MDWRFVLKGLALPPGGFLVLGLIGLVTYRRHPRVGLAICAAAIATLWLLSTPVIADQLARLLEQRYPAFDPAHLSAAERGAEAIVILGGGVRRAAPEVGFRDTPNSGTLERLIEGARVARATQLPVLVSGSYPEALAMSTFLAEDMQIPVRWVESASRDTHENAVFSARLLRASHVGRIILVTSAAHMPRSVREFTAAGLEVSAAPAVMWSPLETGFPRKYVPTIDALDRSYTVLYEWGGDIAHGHSLR